MLYISPINEGVCRNGLADQVLEWSGAIEDSKAVLAGQMKSDIDELKKNWLPGDNVRANLMIGWRRRIRYVFGYNGNAQITHYAKLELCENDVHLHWIVGCPGEVGRIECGEGVVPFRAMLAFFAKVGQIQQKPIFLLADTDALVTKYAESGFEVTGKMESSKKEMILKLENISRPSQKDYKGQMENEHWIFSGEGTLAEYLEDGSK